MVAVPSRLLTAAAPAASISAKPTAQPSRTNRSAAASPMPLAAPVIRIALRVGDAAR
jgi:hypothetical protein